MQPIFFITGPPAAGKSTLAKALLQKYPSGYHISVDTIRDAVVSGLASNSPWTDETTKQFALAEQAACDLALRYNNEDFAVVIDHCQGPPTLDCLIEERLQGRLVVKFALVPSLEINLNRNRLRTSKDFDSSFLVPTISRLNQLYAKEPIHEQGWIVFDNSGDDVFAAAEQLFHLVT
jgi:energy-coupling factor transporter ATP-binding protein EcfA2